MALRTVNGMSLCAGIGGLDLGVKLGLRYLGAELVGRVYVEREAYAAACLVARMESKTLAEAPIWDDISTFDGRPWRGRTHLILAGFPCQPWSAAGQRRGTDDERWLWPDIARIVREVEPEWVFLENVPGLVRGGLEQVLWDLALCGFDAEGDVFSAAETGAPHLRERLFIPAHARRECGERLGGDGVQGAGERMEAGADTASSSISRYHAAARRAPRGG